MNDHPDPTAGAEPDTAAESLPDAFARLGLQQGPTLDELRQLTPEQRAEAFAASSVRTQAQFDELPAWFRERLRSRAEARIGRRGTADEGRITHAS